MNLVILESSTKTKALQSYLGKAFLVRSSNGHITKLANKGLYGLGVDLETFSPFFILDKTKKKILDQLKILASKADKIYLATDPDREGEAIAFHLADNLGQPKKIIRVVFNEITKNAVLSAFKKPGKINQLMVESQFTRRILDRMIGYRLSKLLQRHNGARSAGRVQSVALRLIIERETIIKNFKSKKSWVISCHIGDFLFLLKKAQNKNIIINTPELRDTILKNLTKKLILTNIIRSNWKLNSPKPFKTASLLQAAAHELKFSAKKTMFIAQQLYEGVKINGEINGLISYPRTDSRRINQEFATKIRASIKKQFGEKYVASEIVSKTTKKEPKIQDAHEAIRITEIDFTPVKISEFLSNDQKKLYTLIYQTTFASFMSPTTGEQLIFELTSADYTFQWIIRTQNFFGFTKILSATLPLVFPINKIPNWSLNKKILTKEFLVSAKETKPPARYSEALLIKELEFLGIGRPSTYSGFATKLITWNYIQTENHRFIPTEIGTSVTDFLRTDFDDFVNSEYTAQMEVKLDQIASGKITRKKILNDFWNKFNDKVELVFDKINKRPRKMIDKVCPQCENGKLQERHGRFGTFFGCETYPKCRFIEKSESSPHENLTEKCPECSSFLRERKGRYGKFIGCSSYPKCRYILKKSTIDNLQAKCPNCDSDLSAPDNDQMIKCLTKTCDYQKKIKVSISAVELDRNCPQENCGKALLERKGRFGKFVACSGFPNCRFIEKKTKTKIIND